MEIGWWRRNYPDKTGNQDFIEGAIITMRLYATWHNGKQYIRDDRPLEAEIKGIKDELGYRKPYVNTEHTW